MITVGHGISLPAQLCLRLAGTIPAPTDIQTVALICKPLPETAVSPTDYSTWLVIAPGPAAGENSMTERPESRGRTPVIPELASLETVRGDYKAEGITSIYAGRVSRVIRVV